MSFGNPFPLPQGFVDAISSYVSFQNTDTTSNLNTSAFSPLPVFGQHKNNESSNNQDFTVLDDERLQCNFSGVVTVEFDLYVIGTGQRDALQARVEIGGSVVGSIASTGYIRNQNGHNHSSLHKSGETFQCSQGDIIRIVGRRESTVTGTIRFDGVGAATLTIGRKS